MNLAVCLMSKLSTKQERSPRADCTTHCSALRPPNSPNKNTRRKRASAVHIQPLTWCCKCLKCISDSVACRTTPCVRPVPYQNSRYTSLVQCNDSFSAGVFTFHLRRHVLFIALSVKAVTVQLSLHCTHFIGAWALCNISPRLHPPDSSSRCAWLLRHRGSSWSSQRCCVCNQVKYTMSMAQLARTVRSRRHSRPSPSHQSFHEQPHWCKSSQLITLQQQV